MERLKTSREKDDFMKHLRKYINIWLPDCPFEVATTNRYTIVTREAAIYARRVIKRGETIKYLCGNLVAMTEEEEKDLDLTRRDFSIVMSSRKKTPSLFLGPARFANHDCDANARLTTTGSDGMQIVAVRNIHQDEEITVTYGEDYFGNENCECLCRSCELSGQGGWTVPPESLTNDSIPLPSREESNGPYGFRRKRKYASSPISVATTPDPEMFRPTKWRCSSTTDQSRSSSRGPKSRGRPPKKDKRRSTLSRYYPDTSNDNVTLDSTPALETSPVPIIAPPEAELKAGLATTLARGIDTPSKTLQPQEILHNSVDQDSLTIALESTSSSTGDMAKHYSPETPTKQSRLSQTSSESTDIDSVFEADEVELIASGTPSSPHSSHSDRRAQTTSPNKVEELSAAIPTASLETSATDITNIQVKEEPAETPKISKRSYDESDSELSSLESDEEFDDINFCIARKRKPPTAKKRKLAPAEPILVDPEVPQTRYPSDYINTSLLLAEPESKWVQCKTCSGVWVQQNAYYTRRECPRCERHSKLYGYQWPKTEQLKGDPERVKDHREVHRFLDAEEEEELRRKQRELASETEVIA